MIIPRQDMQSLSPGDRQVRFKPNGELHREWHICPVCGLKRYPRKGKFVIGKAPAEYFVAFLVGLLGLAATVAIGLLLFSEVGVGNAIAGLIMGGLLARMLGLNIIIETERDGTRRAAPPDWFSELRFK